MSDVYRARVTPLIRNLCDRREMVESWESLRGLIEKIMLLMTRTMGIRLICRVILARF